MMDLSFCELMQAQTNREYGIVPDDLPSSQVRLLVGADLHLEVVESLLDGFFRQPRDLFVRVS